MWYNPKVGSNKSHVVHCIVKQSRNNNYIELKRLTIAIYKFFERSNHHGLEF